MHWLAWASLGTAGCITLASSATCWWRTEAPTSPCACPNVPGPSSAFRVSTVDPKSYNPLFFFWDADRIVICVHAVAPTPPPPPAPGTSHHPHGLRFELQHLGWPCFVLKLKVAALIRSVRHPAPTALTLGSSAPRPDYSQCCLLAVLPLAGSCCASFFLGSAHPRVAVAFENYHASPGTVSRLQLRM